MSLTPMINAQTCLHAKNCSGCSLWDLKYSDQLELKKKELENLLNQNSISLLIPIKMHGFPTLHFRDRTDVSLFEGQLGFYRNDKSKKILDIQVCELFSSSLQQWFTIFKAIIHKHHDFLKSFKVSFRLRVSPERKYGVWIDTSHETTKKLFDQKEFLLDLLDVSLVEIGQRLKRLESVQGDLKLSREPVMSYWMNSFDKNGRELKLYSSIGSFTQAGNLPNQSLMNVCIDLITNMKLEQGNCLELFSGMGNFTLMLLSLDLKVTSVEVSKTAFLALNTALLNHEELKSQISFKELSLYKKVDQTLFHGEELLVVDPPRSGLGFVVDELSKITENQKPKHIIYVSCFAETMVEDFTRLRGLGYGIETIVGVDQFAYSHHCEWISYLRLQQ